MLVIHLIIFFSEKYYLPTVTVKVTLSRGSFSLSVYINQVLILLKRMIIINESKFVSLNKSKKANKQTLMYLEKYDCGGIIYSSL